MTASLQRFRRLLQHVSTPADAEFLYDRATPAGALRAANLDRYLALMAARTPPAILVAEAPGYRGATVTGVPFMSVRELTARPGPITGAVRGDGFLAPSDPVAGWELSAAVVWKALTEWSRPVPMAWPIYPNHPFRSGDPATNRAPRPAEVRAGTPIVLELIHALGIPRVLAVGRKAQGALASVGIDAVPIRHPAQGGAGIFARQLAEQRELLGRRR